MCLAFLLRDWEGYGLADFPDEAYTTFHGRLVIIGFGCIGQGVLPLLLRHIKGL